MARRVSSGSKRRRKTIVEAVGRLMTKWKKPQEWKRGAAIVTSRGLRNGMRSMRAASAVNPSGLERCAPFGVPVVPEVRITKRGLSGGGSDWSRHWRRSANRASVPRSRHRSTRLRASHSRPPHPGAPRTPRRRQGPWVSHAAHHLDQLRTGEHRVEIEGAGTELCGGKRRLDEAAVVAAHDPHPIAEADAHRREGVCKRVRATMHLLEGERAAFIYQRRPSGWLRPLPSLPRLPAKRPSERKRRPCEQRYRGARDPEDPRLASTFISKTASETDWRTFEAIEADRCHWAGKPSRY